jgi:hypothetical protein
MAVLLFVKPPAPAPAFPDVAVTTSVLINSNGPYVKTTSALYGYTFSGSGNVYYRWESYDENFADFFWIMFSGSAQTVTTVSGASISLLANKWYFLEGRDYYSGTYSINLTASNTTATQTSATIPLVNWSNSFFNNSITDFTNG